jgi:hypothetical protein
LLKTRATRQAQSVENLRQSGRVADIADPTLLTDAVNLARFVARLYACHNDD